MCDWYPKTPGRHWYSVIGGTRTINEWLQSAGVGSHGGSLFQVRPHIAGDSKWRILELCTGVKLDRHGRLVAEFDVVEREQGAVRLPPSRREDACAVLGLVTASDWRCERGIPVVVSRQVYSQYLRKRLHANATVEVDMEARLVMLPPPVAQNSFLPAVGGEVPSGLQEYFARQLNIPPCYLEVLSLLDFRGRSHCGHPDAIVSVIGEFVGPHVKSGMEHPFRFFTWEAVINPTEEDRIVSMVRSMREWWEASMPVSYLNDFDGQRRRIRSCLPSRASPFTKSGSRTMAALTKRLNEPNMA